MEDLTGKRLGPYQIVAPLGEGNMAVVYRASLAKLAGTDRVVALKVLPRHLANDPVAVGRFQQEARILSSLRHPNILPLLDFGEVGGYTYIAMPVAENGSLANYFRGVPLPTDEMFGVVWQVADALYHAHLTGVVHRDMKPSNILLDQYGNCMLTDFGIAKLVSGAARFTGAGLAVGTPTYMSPEQALATAVDHRSDIYSLGVILYQMATGRVPFEAKTPVALVMKHINDPLPSPRAFNPALTPEIEQVIAKSLAKKPDDRYATASEMASALQEAMLGRG